MLNKYIKGASALHRQSSRDIFAITIIKTIAAFFVIAVYLLTGIV